MVPVFAVTLSWTLILDQLFANNPESSAGMLKTATSPFLSYGMPGLSRSSASAPNPRPWDREPVVTAAVLGWLCRPVCRLWFPCCIIDKEELFWWPEMFGLVSLEEEKRQNFVPRWSLGKFVIMTGEEGAQLPDLISLPAPNLEV